MRLTGVAAGNDVAALGVCPRVGYLIGVVPA
jgi:hypothetical protein